MIDVMKDFSCQAPRETQCYLQTKLSKATRICGYSPFTRWCDTATDTPPRLGKWPV